MAKLANTFVSTDAVGNREELSDVVSRITPEDTPIWSMLKKTGSDGTHPEWEIDELAPAGENAQPEGNEFDFDAVDSPDRVGNYAQILSKTLIVSETQEAVKNAGRVEKLKHQKLKKGIEVRKDIEFAILNNQASKATDPRKMGGLPSWYETNVSRGAGGANGGFNAGTGLTVAATPGTQRAFAKGLMDNVSQQIYESGGNTRYAFCAPYVKSVFVSFMSDSNVAQFRYAATQGKNAIVATADVYEGPFGKVAIVPNRVQSSNASMASNVHLLDPAYASMKMLRKIQSVKNLAKTGDAEKGAIVGEGTLCVKNEAAHGVIADVFGLSAST